MLKRALLLCLSLWLMAAGGLTAHAGPCHQQGPAEAAAPATAHDHCDMMAGAPQAPAPVSDEDPEAPRADTPCCCPAVLAALPATPAPGACAPAFARPASFPLDASAPSRTLIPEPPPPKA